MEVTGFGYKVVGAYLWGDMKGNVYKIVEGTKPLIQDIMDTPYATHEYWQNRFNMKKADKIIKLKGGGVIIIHGTKKSFVNTQNRINKLLHSLGFSPL